MINLHKSMKDYDAIIVLLKALQAADVDHR